MGTSVGMAPGKQINFKVSQWMYERLLEEQKKSGFYTMTELLEEIIRYYFKKDEHAQFQKEGVIEFLKSDEGKLWFSTLLDEELIRRATPKHER
jgi:hypothetical protein